MNIKITISPDKPLYIEGREVISYLAKESTDDRVERLKRLSGQGRKKAMYIKSIDSFGFENKYYSIGQAKEKTGISRSSISKCINGLQKTAGGLKWEKI